MDVSFDKCIWIELDVLTKTFFYYWPFSLNKLNTAFNCFNTKIIRVVHRETNQLIWVSFILNSFNYKSQLLLVYDWLFIYIGIRLNFKRTICSTRRCTFRNCATPTDRLRGVKKLDRFKALKCRKIYIPFGAKLCRHHVLEKNWLMDMDDETVFSRNQIEDLISLFYSSGGISC